MAFLVRISSFKKLNCAKNKNLRESKKSRQLSGYWFGFNFQEDLNGLGTR